MIPTNIAELLFFLPQDYIEACLRAWALYYAAQSVIHKPGGTERHESGSKDTWKITTTTANLLNSVRPHPDLAPKGDWQHNPPHVHTKNQVKNGGKL